MKDLSKELFKQYMETRNTRSRLVSVHRPILMDMDFGVGVIKKLQGTEVEVDQDLSSKRLKRSFVGQNSKIWFFDPGDWFHF